MDESGLTVSHGIITSLLILSVCTSVRLCVLYLYLFLGDLAFGAPFGMINAARDAAPVAMKHEAAIANYGNSGSKTAENPVGEVVEIPAVKILNERGEFSSSLGVLPPRWRPFLRRFVPWFTQRNVSVENVAGMSIAAVSRRLANPTDRTDLLAKLQQGKDDEGKLMGREELTAEAQTQMIAGSDTTSKCVKLRFLFLKVLPNRHFSSSCAITYYLARNPSVQTKLQKELDDIFGPLPSSTDVDEILIPTHEQIKALPYLQAVINETLRLHSTSGVGLPRVVPEGGMTVLGKTFPEGAVLSVPTYSLHRNPEAWGDDVDQFRPERWIDGHIDHSEMMKSFNPFSFGPRYFKHLPSQDGFSTYSSFKRACIGRHFAMMELQIFVAAIFRRYEFVLEKPDKNVGPHSLCCFMLYFG